MLTARGAASRRTLSDRSQEGGFIASGPTADSKDLTAIRRERLAQVWIGDGAVTIVKDGA